MKAKNTYLLAFSTCLILLMVACKSKQPSSTEPTKIADNGKGISEADRVKFQSAFYNGCKEKMKGNIELAENIFKECLKIDPSSAPVKYELAGLYKFTGLYDEALKYSKEAATADPKNPWFQLVYIECLHNKRQFNEAAAAYEKLIKNNPAKPEYFTALADEYIFAGKPEKATKVLEDYEKTFGRDEEIALKRVNIYRQLKNFNEAEKELKALIKDFPEEPQYYSFLAEIYQDKGEPEKALSTYQEILKTSPDNPYIHLALADYYRRQKQDSLFFTEVKTAFKSPDLDIDNKVKILVSYYEMTEIYPKYKPEAYELLDIMMKGHPNEPKAWSVNADFLYRDKKYKEAKVALEKVLEYDKSRYAIWNQLMVCEMDLNDFYSLKSHSEEAMDLFPSQPTAYFFNGLAHLRLKDYKASIQSFLDGQEFVYDNAPLQLQFLSSLAEAYNADKQYEKSDKAFDAALEMQPNDPLIMNNFAYYLSLRKEKLEKAEKLSARTLEIQPGSISYMDTYAWILYQQGKYTEAKTWLEKALGKGADSRAAILEHYGDVLYKLNEPVKAVEYWKKAKEKGGNSEMLNKKINDGKLYE